MPPSGGEVVMMTKRVIALLALVSASAVGCAESDAENATTSPDNELRGVRCRSRVG